MGWVNKRGVAFSLRKHGAVPVSHSFVLGTCIAVLGNIHTLPHERSLEIPFIGVPE